MYGVGLFLGHGEVFQGIFQFSLSRKETLVLNMENYIMNQVWQMKKIKEIKLKVLTLIFINLKIL